MTDHTLRTLARTASPIALRQALARAGWPAGHGWPLVDVFDMHTTRPRCHKHGVPPESCCKGSYTSDPEARHRVRLAWDASAVTRVLALCGDEVKGRPFWKCDVEGCGWGGGNPQAACPQHGWRAKPWLAGLQALAADLPDLRVDGAETSCGVCKHGWSSFLDEPCTKCNGTGTRPHTVPAARWLSVAAAVGAARAVWERVDVSTLGPTPTRGVANVLRAIEAAEAWLRCPCPEREKACAVLLERLSDAGVGTLYVSQPWSPLLAAVCHTSDSTAVSVCVEAAAQALSPEAVRAACAAAVLGRLWPEREGGTE